MGRPLKNIIGKRFGHLVALHPERIEGKVYWLCQCDCGKQVYSTAAYLNSGRKKSCGCMNWEKQRKDSQMKMKLRKNMQKAGLVRRFEGITAFSKKRAFYQMGVSGVRGVSWVGSVGKWEVRLQVNGERIDGGRFETLNEAIEVRERLEREYVVPQYKDYLKKKKELLDLSGQESEQGVTERMAELKKEIHDYERRGRLVRDMIEKNKERNEKKAHDRLEKQRKGFNPEL